VDNAFVLRRERGRAEAVLHLTGRDLHEQALALGFDAAVGMWTIVGDAREV
jgi:hypothetical protein